MVYVSFKLIWQEMLKNNGHIHVYSSIAGTDNPLALFFFQEYKFSVNLVIYCKFYHLNDFLAVLSI